MQKEKIGGEYQCEHVKDKTIDSDCVWCCLTVAEKGLVEQRRQRIALEEKLKAVEKVKKQCEGNK